MLCYKLNDATGFCIWMDVYNTTIICQRHRIAPQVETTIHPLVQGIHSHAQTTYGFIPRLICIYPPIIIIWEVRGESSSPAECSLLSQFLINLLTFYNPGYKVPYVLKQEEIAVISYSYVVDTDVTVTSNHIYDTKNYLAMQVSHVLIYP